MKIHLAPSCKACKRFKEKDFQKIVDQFPNTDWNEVNAFDSGIEEFSSPGILPKWNFFVDGKLQIEFPGVVWRNIDDAVCDCEWKKGLFDILVSFTNILRNQAHDSNGLRIRYQQRARLFYQLNKFI